jgi:hypothetical protein
VVSFVPWYPFDMRLGERQKQAGRRYREQKHLMLRSEPQFLGRPACSQVTVPTELKSKIYNVLVQSDEILTSRLVL